MRDLLGRVGARTATGRRRLYLRLGAAAAAAALLVAAPAYVASQPQFLRRYPNMGAQYETWSASVHANVSCRSCHVPPDRVSQTLHGARMLGEFYLSLVSPSRRPDLMPAPVNGACQSCHIDLRTVSPSGDLNIPHRAHVVVLGLTCVRCHKFLVHRTNPGGTHTPWMAGCLVCHDGRTAKRECSACHTDKRVPEGHRAADWLVVHSQRQKVIDCAKCHRWTEDWCVRCHSRRPRLHTARWRTDHRDKVKAHRNCEACHAGTFCFRCHGEVPGLNLDPALGLVR